MYANYRLTCTEHICINYVCDLLDCNTLRIKLVALSFFLPIWYTEYVIWIRNLLWSDFIIGLRFFCYLLFTCILCYFACEYILFPIGNVRYNAFSFFLKKSPILYFYFLAYFSHSFPPYQLFLFQFFCCWMWWNSNI